MKNNDGKILLILFYPIMFAIIAYFGINMYKSSYTFYIDNDNVNVSIDSTYEITIITKKEGLSSNENYSFVVENDDVISINDKGEVTPKKEGSTVVQVKSKKSKEVKEMVITIVNEPVFLVDVDNTNIVLNKGQSYKIKTSVNEDDSVVYSLKYSSSDDNVAVVDKNGFVRGIKAGKSVITITSPSGVKAECYVTVIDNTKRTSKPSSPTKPNSPNTPSSNVIYPSGITLSASTLNLKVGTTASVSAYISPDNATNKKITWKSSNTNVATISNGSIRAIGVGSAYITATTANNKVARVLVNVTNNNIAVDKVTLNTSSVTLNVGGTTTLRATVSPSTATNNTVTWTSSNTSIATVTNGVVKGIKAGTATITAKTSNGKSASATITVNNVSATGITLNITSKTIYIGDTLTLTPTITPSTTTNKSITWKSDNASIATVSNGVVVARAAGTANITATTSNGKIATAKIVAIKRPVNVTSVNVTPTSANLTVGKTVTLTGSVVPSNADNKTITWKSSNTNIATVSNGVVTAKAIGNATITATSNNGKIGSATINVTAASVPPTGVSLSTTSLSMFDETSATVTATVQPSNANNKTVTWSSDNTSVATVSNGKITAKKSGSANITVKTSNGKTNTVKVTVKAYKVLMVGNSKTYVKNLNTMYKNMLDNGGFSNTFTSVVEGGKTLSWHYSKRNTAKTSEYRSDETKLKNTYDIVILQEQTARAKSELSDYKKGALNLANLFRTKNSRVKIYVRQTWPITTDQSSYATYLSNANTVNSYISGAGVIKDGNAFKAAIATSDFKKGDLYGDERHQSQLGAYLAAACIYKKTTGRNPENLTYYGKTSSLSALNTTKAKKLLKIANSSC